MSYDVDIGDRDFNVTFNISKLFYDHIYPLKDGDRGGLHALHGLTGRQAASVIGQAFQRIDQTRMALWEENDVGETGFRQRYDAPNGWGSAIGGLVFLANLMAACQENPRKRVSVSA